MTLPCYVDARGPAVPGRALAQGPGRAPGPDPPPDPGGPAPPRLPGRRASSCRSTRRLRGDAELRRPPPLPSTLGTLASLPTIAARLWKAVGRAEIVHANAGGWPISFGWIAIPMAKLRGKFALTNVESGGWRLGFKPPWRLKPLLQGIVFESMARMIVNLSDIATFTHAGYRETHALPSRGRTGATSSRASWIDREDILPRAEAEALWAGQAGRPGAGRSAWSSRPACIPAKGVGVLLEAVEELDRRRGRRGRRYLRQGAAARRLRRGWPRGWTGRSRWNSAGCWPTASRSSRCSGATT